jgi:hypothetical protein
MGRTVYYCLSDLFISSLCRRVSTSKGITDWKALNTLKEMVSGR